MMNNTAKNWRTHTITHKHVYNLVSVWLATCASTLMSGKANTYYNQVTRMPKLTVLLLVYCFAATLPRSHLQRSSPWPVCLKTHGWLQSSKLQPNVIRSSRNCLQCLQHHKFCVATQTQDETLCHTATYCHRLQHFSGQTCPDDWIHLVFWSYPFRNCSKQLAKATRPANTFQWSCATTAIYPSLSVYLPIYLGEEKASLLLFCSHLKFIQIRYQFSLANTRCRHVLPQSIASLVKVQASDSVLANQPHAPRIWADITGHVDSTWPDFYPNTSAFRKQVNLWPKWVDARGTKLQIKLKPLCAAVIDSRQDTSTQSNTTGNLRSEREAQCSLNVCFAFWLDASCTKKESNSCSPPKQGGKQTYALS